MTARKYETRYAVCGSGIFIPDPNFFHPGSWILIKEFKYFNPKERFLSYRKYDSGCWSRVRILTFYPSRISDPGSRGQKSTGSRIRQHCRYVKWTMHLLNYFPPFFGFLSTLFSTATSADPQISLCQTQDCCDFGMGSQESLYTRLDLIIKARSHPQGLNLKTPKLRFVMFGTDTRYRQTILLTSTKWPTLSHLRHTLFILLHSLSRWPGLVHLAIKYNFN
jgi:hypothetical protein